jgi:hypothetical protein
MLGSPFRIRARLSKLFKQLGALCCFEPPDVRRLAALLDVGRL